MRKEITASTLSFILFHETIVPFREVKRSKIHLSDLCSLKIMVYKSLFYKKKGFFWVIIAHIKIDKGDFYFNCNFLVLSALLNMVTNTSTNKYNLLKNVQSPRLKTLWRKGPISKASNRSFRLEIEMALDVSRNYCWGGERDILFLN